jgi:hypothetical protein
MPWVARTAPGQCSGAGLPGSRGCVFVLVLRTFIGGLPGRFYLIESQLAGSPQALSRRLV